MRITHRMLATSVANNLNRNMRRLEDMAARLSSGRKFDRPSQDPVGTVKVMRLHGALASNAQYGRNITMARGWLDATESALGEGVAVMQRLRELSVYAASGVMTAADRQAIVPEVSELRDHLLSLANSEHMGLHIFAGHRTLDAPFEATLPAAEPPSFSYVGDTGERTLEISAHDDLVLNITGAEAFGGYTDVNDPDTFDQAFLLNTVAAMEHYLETNDADALSGENLQAIDQALDRLLKARAQVGARQARLNSAEDRLFNEEIHMREARSKIEDIDFAEAIMEYSMQENAYRAALATGARMIQPSLIDFLR